MRKMILAMILLAAPSSVIAQDQFDLVCQTKFKPRVFAKPELGERRYRIDLAEKLWCYGSCENTSPIAEVTNTMLTLTRVAEESLRSERSERHWIDRRTGELSYSLFNRTVLGTRYEELDGKCERQPFSGFPKPVTQF